MQSVFSVILRKIHYTVTIMAKASKILFISQEITPYLPQSEMSIIGRELPQKIQESGKEIRTFMPKWGNINERRNQLHEVIRLSGMNIIIDDTDHTLVIKVASIQAARMQVYFIDNDDYFQQTSSTDVDACDYEDNDERTIFCARGALETVKKLRWCPDVIHCQGWISSLVPLYIKKAYNDEPSFRNSKIVLSLFDSKFEGKLPSTLPEKALMRGIESADIDINRDNIDCNELSRLAIDYADGIITHGPNIDKGLVDYAVSRGLPVIGYNGEDDFADRCNALYDTVFDK